MLYSAANRGGLIEAHEYHGNRSLELAYSAANRGGLIEATWSARAQ